MTDTPERDATPRHDGNTRVCPGCGQQTMYWRPTITQCAGDPDLAEYLGQPAEHHAHVVVGYETQCCPEESRAASGCMVEAHQ